MLDIDTYILEYNDEQRMFHYNSGENQINTHGWIALKRMSKHECSDFCEFMYKKYERGRKTGTLPELIVVQLELDLFFKLRKYGRKLAGRI